MLGGRHGGGGEAFGLLQGLVALGAGEETGGEFIAEDGEAFLYGG